MLVLLLLLMLLLHLVCSECLYAILDMIRISHRSRQPLPRRLCHLLHSFYLIPFVCECVCVKFPRDMNAIASTDVGTRIAAVMYASTDTFLLESLRCPCRSSHPITCERAFYFYYWYRGILAHTAQSEQCSSSSLPVLCLSLSPMLLLFFVILDPFNAICHTVCRRPRRVCTFALTLTVENLLIFTHLRRSQLALLFDV